MPIAGIAIAVSISVSLILLLSGLLPNACDAGCSG